MKKSSLYRYGGLAVAASIAGVAVYAASGAGSVTAPKGGVNDAPLAPMEGAAYAAAPQTGAPPSNPLKNCYFGDLHLHTSYSADAFALGTRTTPEDSFRYARGETIMGAGKPRKRKAALDFLAVTDHAEYLGIMPQVPDPKGPFAGTKWQQNLASTDPAKKREIFNELNKQAALNEPITDLEKPELIASTWKKYAAFADKYNQPGKFTAFVGFEWTSAPGYNNMHRCVIFKDKAPDLPYTCIESQDPEELWTYLDKQRAAGLDVVAIPHNGNISGGLMFDAQKTYAGKPITKEYAERRIKNEPLFEIVQTKGQSDTIPELSPNDEFANFETYRYMLASSTPNPHSDRGSFIRQAYARGMEISQKVGANPFKYGMEAGTDFHQGVTSTEEFNYYGAHGFLDAKEMFSAYEKGGPPNEIRESAGGLTGVWAQSNTRESIFAGFKRRETFGTSGNRIKVRMFAGYDYPKNLTSQDGWVKAAYAGGIPMGSDLPVKAGAKAPTFLVQALKDPDSSNLDRIQIIKIATKNGQSTTKIYDVVWSGNRAINPKTGKLPAVGNTVDAKNATYKNAIGAAELKATWTDPNFAPSASASYYARVLEIPTPRWTTYWAKNAGLALPTKLVKSDIQERAWTSPIFYRN